MNELEHYQALGFKLLPIDSGKQPLWWRAQPPPFTSRGPYLTEPKLPKVAHGVALVLGPYWVIDVDPRNGGHWSRLPSVPRTWVSRTRSGGHHIYFKGSAIDRPSKPWPGIDLLTGFRYCIEAPTPGYTWINAPWDTELAELPEWVPVREPYENAAPRAARSIDYDRMRSRAEWYAEAYPGAVSGENGHVRTFLLAQRLVHQFGLRERDVMDIMKWWNSKCKPEWSEKELAHKIQSAIRSGTMQNNRRST